MISDYHCPKIITLDDARESDGHKLKCQTANVHQWQLNIRTSANGFDFSFSQAFGRRLTGQRTPSTVLSGRIHLRLQFGHRNRLRNRRALNESSVQCRLSRRRLQGRSFQPTEQHRRPGHSPTIRISLISRRLSRAAVGTQFPLPNSKPVK